MELKRVSWLGLLGVCLTFVVGGVQLIVSHGSTPQTVGIVVLVLGVLLGVGALCLDVYWRVSARSAASSNAALAHLQEGARTLIDSYNVTVHDLMLRVEEADVHNDAAFVPRGFIGLQEACLHLDADEEVGPERERMAVLGHLPSHVRADELSLDRGMQLYDNWQPPHLVEEYVHLVNRRRAALLAFLERGGHAREVYDKRRVREYVEEGSTFADDIIDPPDELISRLRGLRQLLVDYPRYRICFVDQDHSGPQFLLKQEVGLVVDLRTTQSSRHFTDSVDALRSKSSVAMGGFASKFNLTWQAHDRDRAAAQAFIDDMLAVAQRPSHHG